jgi:hypothetical protein
MTLTNAELREQLTTALSNVTAAENALEKALRALTTRPRAEKVAVTDVVADAFAQLKAAHATLSSLRASIADP